MPHTDKDADERFDRLTWLATRLMSRETSTDDLALLDEIAACLASEVEQRRRVERELAETSERLEALFDFTPALLQVGSLDGRILYVNRAWRALLDYDDAELPALRVSDIVVPELRIEYLGRVDAALRGETAPPFDTVLLARTGRRTVVRALIQARVVDGAPVVV